jgi:hypothetical protein
MLFVDVSALVKRYGRERHSVKVRRFLTAAPIAISRLSEVEVPSALAPPRSRAALTPTVQGSGDHGVRNGHRSLARR